MPFYFEPDRVTSPEPEIDRGRALPQKVHPQSLLTDSPSVSDSNRNISCVLRSSSLLFLQSSRRRLLPASSRAENLVELNCPHQDLTPRSRGGGRAGPLNGEVGIISSASSTPSIFRVRKRLPIAECRQMGPRIANRSSSTNSRLFKKNILNFRGVILPQTSRAASSNLIYRHGIPAAEVLL